VLKPTAVVELVWQDASGSVAAQTLFAPSSLTVSEIDAMASALASISAPLTGCVLLKQRIKYVVVPDEPNVTSGGAPIVHTGAFFFETTEPLPDGIILVHSVKDSIFQSSGPGAGYIVDSTNSDVIAFIDAVLSANCTNPFGDALTSFFSAYLQSRV